MKRFMERRLKDWPLRPLLLLVFMAFNGSFLLLIAFIINLGVSNLVTEETSNTRLQLLAETHKQLTAGLRNIEETTLTISTHPILRDAISEKLAGTFETIRTMQDVNNVINQFLYSKANISTILLFTDRLYAASNSDQNRIFPLSAITWGADKDRLDKADSIWIGAHPDPYVRYNSQPVVSYVANVYTLNGKLGGYLEVNVVEKMLANNLLHESNRYPGSVLSILDSGGRLISESSSLPGHLNAAEFADQEWLLQIKAKQQEGYQKVKIMGEPYLAIYSSPNHAQWRLLEVIPSKQVYHQVFLIRNLVMGIALFGFLLSFPLASYLSRRIIRPIPELLGGFRRIQNGDFETRMLENNNIVEFRQLSASFNQMANQLKELLENLEEEHRAKREAEFRALQSQINPHFLYNTLDMINWTAALKGAHEVSAMAAKLAKLFRISLSTGKTFVKLGEELEHGSLYAQIQQIRYKDRFHYFEAVDPRLKALFVPKLILQPFIENAIIHGFGESSEEIAEVSVKAELLSDTLLRLVVENNGSPLPDDWQSLSERKGSGQGSPGADGGSGYGISNVRQRIQLYLGTEYDVRLMNREPKGVRVEITLPVVTSMNKLG